MNNIIEEENIKTEKKDLKKSKIKKSLPISLIGKVKKQKENLHPTIILFHSPIFLFEVKEIFIYRKFSSLAFEKMLENKQEEILLTIQKMENNTEIFAQNDILEIGIIAKIVSYSKENVGYRVKLLASYRVKITKLILNNNYYIASYEDFNEIISVDFFNIWFSKLNNLLQELTINDILNEMKQISTLSRIEIIFILAGLIFTTNIKKIEILSLSLEDIAKEILKYFQLIKYQKEVEENLNEETKKILNKKNYEFFLREQRKLINEKLDDEKENLTKELQELKMKIDNLIAPETTKKIILEEFNQIIKHNPFSSEYSILLQHLNWIINLPFNQKTTIDKDLSEIKILLDEEFYGMNNIKEKIMEIAAKEIRNLKYKNNINSGAVILLLGPPGVGKSTIAEAIAKSLNRKYVRISMAGCDNSSFLKGHRKTYVGAIPGFPIQKMKEAGVKNPVFQIDEVDKIQKAYDMDPSSVLLQLYDANQNKYFEDEYLGIPFDFSDVLFILTANELTGISSMLRDRLDIITIKGYTLEEKRHILQLAIKKISKKNFLTNSEVIINNEICEYILHLYRSEVGLRSIEKLLQNIYNHAVFLLEKHNLSSLIIDKKIIDYLFLRENTTKSAANMIFQKTT